MLRLDQRSSHEAGLPYLSGRRLITALPEYYLRNLKANQIPAIIRIILSKTDHPPCSFDLLLTTDKSYTCYTKSIYTQNFIDFVSKNKRMVKPMFHISSQNKCISFNL
jgi:hypothetical protein